MPVLFALLLTLQGPSATLGVRVADLPPIVAASSAINNLRGALVTALQPGGAAERAGIHVNDIIVAIGNENVNAAGDVSLIMTLHKGGDVVAVNFVRPGNALPWPKMILRATLAGGAATQSTPPATGIYERSNGVNVAPPTPPAAATTARSVSNTAPVAVSLVNSKRCYALAPSGWSIVSRDIGDAADVTSADGRVYAGWIIHGVERMQERVYGELFGDPQASSRATIEWAAKNMGQRGGMQYVGQPREIGAGFIGQEVQGQGMRGMVIYKVYPPAFGMSQGSYIISLRMALAPDDASGALNTAVGVSTSINCNVGLEVHDQGDMKLPRPGDVFDKRRKSEANDLTDYNSTLNTQYAHSPSTGQTFLMDRSSQWNETGPDGPGYYRKVGNSQEKLVPGIQ